jgi:hypothetical protein
MILRTHSVSRIRCWRMGWTVSGIYAMRRCSFVFISDRWASTFGSELGDWRSNHISRHWGDFI